MLQALIYSPNKKGYTNFTEFVFESRSLSDTSIQKYLWTISDGTLYYNTPRVTHKFYNSGVYTVKLTVWDEENKQQTTSITVQTQQYLSDTIYFKHIPTYFSGPGVKTDTPITVSFTTTITSQPPVISFYADNSRSIPANASITTTWNSLIPTWRFYDLSGNIVTQLTATDYTPVYFDSKLIGYHGNVDFYFVEDIGINNPFLEQPTIIFATLQTTTQNSDRLNSTQNSIQKATFWYTDKPIPTNLQVKETTINDIYTTKWSSIKIPYLVTVGYKNKGYKISTATPNIIEYRPLNATKTKNNELYFVYPDSSIPSPPIQRSVTNTFNLLPSAFTETINTSSSRLQLVTGADLDYTLSYPTTASVTINFNVKDYVIPYNYSVSNVQLFKQDQQGLPIAGFAFDSVYIQTSSTRNVELSVSLTIPASTYTPSFFNNTHLLVVNPDVKLINRIYSLPHTHKNLTHNKLIYSKVLETEKIESNDIKETFATVTSAFPTPRNLYSIAADPIDNTFWATDPDTSFLYKFNQQNKLLTAVNLLLYFDTDDRYLNSKNVPSNRYTPIHIKQDGDRNLWVSFYKNFNLLKIDNNGNIITQTNYLGTTAIPPVDSKVTERNLSVYTLIDVDSQSNVWATHTSYLYNELRKYNSQGSLLTSIPLPTVYNPTSIHIDAKDNVWITTSVTPYLLKPSQDRYGHYWDWFNLRENKNAPLKWKDTRFVGLTNDVVEREIYPSGKYPKTWNREAYNGQKLTTNFTFTVTNSSRTSLISGLSSFIQDVEVVDPDYTLEVLRVSSITVPSPQTFIATFPVSALDVLYSPQTLAITPPVTANIKMRIASKTNIYYPGLYDTQVNYVSAETKIVIEVPQQRKAYIYKPGFETYGTTLLQVVSTIISPPTLTATTISRITAVAPDYTKEYIYNPNLNTLFTFKATYTINVRKQVYPISALPIQKIIPGYTPGLFFNVFNFDYYTKNVYSLANTFTKYTDAQYSTVTTGNGDNLGLGFFSLANYTGENDLGYSGINSLYGNLTGVDQIIPDNYGNVYCFNLSGSLVKNYSKKFNRPESIITDNDNNVWLTHNYNHFTRINPITDDFQTWKIDPKTGYIFSVVKLLSSKFEPNSTVDPFNVYNNGIRGIHVDMLNRVWLVSNDKQRTYTFYAPNLTKQYRSYNANLINSTKERHRLTQSFGDPTGNIWFRRYILTDIQKTLFYVLTGKSNEFGVQPLQDKHYFRVKNESFDAKEQVKAYALPEVLNRNTTLFDELIGAALGDVLDNRENIGRNIYEKIANFAPYHNNIDTANTESLYSMGQMLGVDIERGFAKLKTPAEIKRLINFTSIPYKKLFGYLNNNLDLKNSYLELIDTNYSYVTAGEILYIKKIQTKQAVTYTVPVTTSITGDFLPLNTSIPFKALQIPELQNYAYNNYEVYKIIPTYVNQLTGSFIDWNSSSTKLASSTKIQNWYEDRGIIEEMFNYVLTKNLLT